MPAGYPALKRWETLVMLAVLVTIFLFVVGPVWQHPWNVTDSIVYSYAPIPFFVAGWLLARRKLSFKAWGLHTVEITVLKFMITASILIVIWMTTARRIHEPKPEAPSPPAVAAVPIEVPIQPTAIDPAQTGRVEGQAAPGALVFVSGGLEGIVFAPPAEAVKIENDGHGFRPALVGVQVGQPLQLVSTDKRLHTFVAEQPDKGWIANVPMLGRPLVFRDPKGVLTIRCSVHGDAEGLARVGVFSHPFFAFAGADGRFAFEQVPSHHLTLTALTSDGATSSASGYLPPGQTLALDLIKATR